MLSTDTDYPSQNILRIRLFVVALFVVKSSSLSSNETDKFFRVFFRQPLNFLVTTTFSTKHFGYRPSIRRTKQKLKKKNIAFMSILGQGLANEMERINFDQQQ